MAKATPLAGASQLALEVKATLRTVGEDKCGGADRIGLTGSHVGAIVRTDRDLTREQIERLVKELPEHQRDMFLLALCTGLRQDNVARLRWEWLDLKRRCGYIPTDSFKNGEDHGFPLNDDAMQILSKCQGVHSEVVFCYGPVCKGGVRGDPRPILSKLSTRAWYKALKRAGIRTSAGTTPAMCGRRPWRVPA